MKYLNKCIGIDWGIAKISAIELRSISDLLLGRYVTCAVVACERQHSGWLQSVS